MIYFWVKPKALESLFFHLHTASTMLTTYVFLEILCFPLHFSKYFFIILSPITFLFPNVNVYVHKLMFSLHSLKKLIYFNGFSNNLHCNDWVGYVKFYPLSETNGSFTCHLAVTPFHPSFDMFQVKCDSFLPKNSILHIHS